jgi:hypothetical protein
MIMRRHGAVLRSPIRGALRVTWGFAAPLSSAFLALVMAVPSHVAYAEKLGAADQPVGVAEVAASEVPASETGVASLSGSPIPSSARLLSAGIIAAGMSFQQVLKAVGPAPEKVEYESSRKNIWHYSDGQVLFREGRVVKVELPNMDVASALLPESVSVPVKVSEPKISKESERVLLEILKEIPSGPEGSAVDSSPHVPSPGSPLTPQALRANPGVAPFGGLSNAEALEDMAE